MAYSKKVQSRREHPGWNVFVHTGMILKVLTALAMIGALWYFK